MVRLFQFLRLFLVALILTGPLSAIADQTQYTTGPGVVLAPMTQSEIDALGLDEEAPITAETLALTQDFLNGIPAAGPLMSSAEDADIVNVHGCHKSTCVPQCPRCAAPAGSNIGHCKMDGALFSCYKTITSR